MMSVRSSPSVSLTFSEEILVAHKSDTKISYHIIIKSYSEESCEVLVKDFQTCGIIAKMVNDYLDDKVRILCKPRSGDPIGINQTTSFIDLGIYNKDRAFRLAFSSKLTSPNRPFVPKNTDTRADFLFIQDTLVVPHTEKIQIIEIKDTVTTTSTVSKDPSSKGIEGRRAKNCRIEEVHPSLNSWIEELVSELPNARKCGRAIKDLRHARFEPVVHFTINRTYASHCRCIGREHKEHNIRISVDLNSGNAYQSCWDQACKGQYLISSRIPGHLGPILSKLVRQNSNESRISPHDQGGRAY